MAMLPLFDIRFVVKLEPGWLEIYEEVLMVTYGPPSPYLKN
jgi:hypothetical protein